MASANRDDDFSTSRSRSNGGASPVNQWLVALLLLLVAILLFRLIGNQPSPLHDPQAEPRTVTARGNLSESEEATIKLFRQASPAVVNITRVAVRRELFSRDITQIPDGTGSGFVWDEQGHIVTNFHVIEGIESNISAEVTLADNSTWSARLVGAEPEKDLAVLKVDAPKSQLKPLKIGRSSDLQVGQSVFAIGNPFGLDQSLTTGVISGLGRQIQAVTRRPIRGVIQTDAAINPGNSGGPLLDSAGRLIGVNTAIYNPTGIKMYSGIGFAVPVDTVNRIVPDLIQDGRVDHPGLGITIMSQSLVENLRRQDILPEKGVVVLDVLENSAAEKAGLKATRETPQGEILWGDVIVGMDGQAIENTDDLFHLLDQHEVGDEVTLKVRRDSQTVEVPVTLQSRPQ